MIRCVGTSLSLSKEFVDLIRYGWVRGFENFSEFEATSHTEELFLTRYVLSMTAAALFSLSASLTTKLLVQGGMMLYCVARLAFYLCADIWWDDDWGRCWACLRSKFWGCWPLFMQLYSTETRAISTLALWFLGLADMDWAGMGCSIYPGLVEPLTVRALWDMSWSVIRYSS